MVAASLAGCGSSATDPTAEYMPKAGDPLYQTLLVDGAVMEEATYRFYGVDGDGNLSATPVAGDESRPLVPLLESATYSPGAGLSPVRRAPLPVNTAITFYKELWTAQKAIHPEYGPMDLNLEIGRLNGGIEELYEYVQRSGLSTKGVVTFLGVVIRGSPDDPNIAGKARAFLEHVEMSPSAMVDALRSLGWTWELFVAKMGAGQTSFNDLFEEYKRSPYSTFPEFLRVYLGAAAAPASPRPMSPEGEVVKAGISILKFYFEVLKNNKPVVDVKNAYTNALSELDSDSSNYVGGTRDAASGGAQYCIRDRSGAVLYSIFMYVRGSYGATNPKFGGQWVPKVEFAVPQVYASWGYNISVNASVDPAENVGTVDSKIPQFNFIANINVSKWFYWKNDHPVFVIHGAKGFKAPLQKEFSSAGSASSLRGAAPGGGDPCPTR